MMSNHVGVAVEWPRVFDRKADVIAHAALSARADRRERLAELAGVASR